MQPLRLQGQRSRPAFGLTCTSTVLDLPRCGRRGQCPNGAGLHDFDRRTRLINEPPIHDHFGLPDARLVAPGSPERSVLIQRISRRGTGQMPPSSPPRLTTRRVCSSSSGSAAFPAEKRQRGAEIESAAQGASRGELFTHGCHEGRDQLLVEPEAGARRGEELGQGASAAQGQRPAIIGHGSGAVGKAPPPDLKRPSWAMPYSM